MARACRSAAGADASPRARDPNAKGNAAAKACISRRRVSITFRPGSKIVEPQRLARVRQILTFFLCLDALHGREAYAIQVRLDLSDPLKLDCKVLAALVDCAANRVEL